MGRTSLFNTTETVRRYLVYFLIFVVIVLVVQLCINLSSGLFRRQTVSVKPSYYSPVNRLYGELATPAIPSLPFTGSPQYAVDNILPEPLDLGVNVYRIIEPVEEFDTEGNAEAIARNFGFKSKAVPGPNGQLTWASGSKVLTFNKVSQNWSFENNNILPPANFGGFSNNNDQYKRLAAGLVTSLGFRRGNLDLDSIEIDYLTKRAGEYTNANSPATARYIKIRVYRNFEAQSLIKGPDGRRSPAVPESISPVSAQVYKSDYLFSAPLDIIVTADTPDQLKRDYIVSLRFNDWQFDDSPGVYELLTPTEAWQLVSQGKGQLRELTENGRRRLEAGRIPNQQVLSYTASYLPGYLELGYLEPDVWTSSGGYLHPIYIFRGKARLANSPNVDNANFTYFISALKPSQ